MIEVGGAVGPGDALSHAAVLAIPYREVTVPAVICGPGYAAGPDSASSRPCLRSRQAVKVTRRRQDAATGKTSRPRPFTPSPSSPALTTSRRTWPACPRPWLIEDRLHDIRGVTFSEDASASRTGSGPAAWPPSGLPSRTSVTCTSPKAGATTAFPPKPSDSTALIRTGTDIHGTRRSPASYQGPRVCRGDRDITCSKFCHACRSSCNRQEVSIVREPCPQERLQAVWCGIIDTKGSNWQLASRLGVMSDLKPVVV